jgi:hypothetical protein
MPSEKVLAATSREKQLFYWINKASCQLNIKEMIAQKWPVKELAMLRKVWLKKYGVTKVGKEEVLFIKGLKTVTNFFMINDLQQSQTAPFEEIRHWIYSPTDVVG